jgi:hypothetical protein
MVWGFEFEGLGVKGLGFNFCFVSGFRAQGLGYNVSAFGFPG